jgi:hypothetical protein
MLLDSWSFAGHMKTYRYLGSELCQQWRAVASLTQAPEKCKQDEGADELQASAGPQVHHALIVHERAVLQKSGRLPYGLII